MFSTAAALYIAGKYGARPTTLVPVLALDLLAWTTAALVFTPWQALASFLGGCT